LELLGIKV